MADGARQRVRPTTPPPTEVARLQALLERSGAACVRLLEQLQQCHGELAALTASRLEGEWTRAQLSSYLSMREREQRLQRRLRRSRRVFDRIRIRLRETETRR